MTDLTEVTNILGDLDTYADELDGEGWHNAANGCRYAKAEIERLRAQRDGLLAALKACGEARDLDEIFVCPRRHRQGGGPMMLKRARRLG